MSACKKENAVDTVSRGPTTQGSASKRASGKWLPSATILLATLWATPSTAQVLTVGDVTQQPPNDVVEGQAVTYTLPVTSDFAEMQFGTIVISVDNDVVTDFSLETGPCDPGGNDTFACNIPVGTTNYQFSWTPPLGTIGVTFDVILDGVVFGSASVTTTVVPAIPGVLDFSASSFVVNETGPSATIEVTRTGGSNGIVTVDYATSDGTADSDSDYINQAGTLTWQDGDTTSKSFSVPIEDDTDFEGDETVNLTLSNWTGGAVPGQFPTATLTIVDNDVPGTLGFTVSAYSVNEDGVSASIDVIRDGGSDGSVSVNISTSDGTAMDGVDYTGLEAATLSWDNGETGIKSATIPILDDTELEGNETVNLILSGWDGASPGPLQTAVLTIVDDDMPGTLGFVSDSFNILEDGGSATIDVIREGGSDGAATVDYSTSDGTATSGADYTAQAGTLSWADGETGIKSLIVPIADDSDFEGDEKLNINLSNWTGGAIPGEFPTAMLFIVDDDLPGTLQFVSATPSVRESAGSATIEVSRSGEVMVRYP